MFSTIIPAKSKGYNHIALTFDIEDWFCAQNLETLFPFGSWDKCESRVSSNTNYILRQLEKRNIKATFFILGWIAERCPDLVKKIANLGHEIATHGYSHKPLNILGPKAFKEELSGSIKILSDLSGQEILGFRAPSFSLTKKTLWAFDILGECNIKYDSSIFPIIHPDYGIADFGQRTKKIKEILEFPLSTARYLRFNIPCAGGGYFRLYPYWFSRFLLTRSENICPLVCYFHPWEFDNSQPRFKLEPLKGFRHYTGLRNNRDKFERFLDDFRFTKICDLFAKEDDHAL